MKYEQQRVSNTTRIKDLEKYESDLKDFMKNRKSLRRENPEDGVLCCQCHKKVNKTEIINYVKNPYQKDICKKCNRENVDNYKANARERNKLENIEKLSKSNKPLNIKKKSKVIKTCFLL